MIVVSSAPQLSSLPTSMLPMRQGDTIHRAADRNTLRLIADSAKILDGGLHAARDDRIVM